MQMLHDTYNDRFSAYLSATQYQELNSTLGGRRDGSIGIAVEPRCAGGALCAAGQTPDRAVIENVLVGQPADRAGVQRGDELTAVDGSTLASLASDENTRITKAAALVRGAVSSMVHLTVMRGGTQLTLVATRANLQIPSVYRKLIGHVLYMQVTGFDTDTGSVARTQLQHGIAAGATSIILDLRQNGGGYVSAAQSLVSEFVQPTATQKNVVVRRGRLSANGSPSTAEEVSNDAIQPGGVALTQPMAVLVDGDSASAAEITAAALHDYHRATVVGEKTFGKGSVQVDFPLPDGADLHLTVERWYGPNGESIEGSGITPTERYLLLTPMRGSNCRRSRRRRLVTHSCRLPSQCLVRRGAHKRSLTEYPARGRRRAATTTRKVIPWPCNPRRRQLRHRTRRNMVRRHRQPRGTRDSGSAWLRTSSTRSSWARSPSASSRQPG